MLFHSCFPSSCCLLGSLVGCKARQQNCQSISLPKIGVRKTIAWLILVRFSASSPSYLILKDKRGWMVDPVQIALDAGTSGGATVCTSVHLGEIRPSGMRGNHRHHTCNETSVIWGAKTKFRLENSEVPDKGYCLVFINTNEVAVAGSPSGTDHTRINLDPVRTTYFLGRQDNVVTYNSTSTDFNIWKDL